MRDLNRAMLIGHVGADPEVRTTMAGARVASFSIATSRRWTSDGGAHEKTDWHRVIAWDALAGVAERHIRKGERLYVEGRVEYRSWDGPDGRPRYATEITAESLLPLDREVVTDFRAVLRAAPQPDPSPNAGPRAAPTGAPRRVDDELPF